MKKVTKKENFEKIIGVLKTQGFDELVQVMQHEIELLDKKKANGKMTKTQEQNEDIKAIILDTLRDSDTPLSITELLNKNTELNKIVGGSNQKASALITQLKNADLVVRTTQGKKAVFSINTEVEGE